MEQVIKIYYIFDGIDIETTTDFVKVGPKIGEHRFKAWKEIRSDVISQKITGQYPTPPLLHVCQHSRAEGLLYYEAMLERNVVSHGGLRSNQYFGYPRPGIKPLPSKRDIVYAHFAVDRFVCVPSSNSRSYLSYER